MCVLSHVWFFATPVDKLLCPWDFSDKNTGAGCHFLLLLLLLLLSCFSRVQLCDPTDRSPLGSSVPGILQTRILEQVTISYSRGSSQPRDWTHSSYVSCIGRQIVYHYCHLGSPAAAAAKLLQSCPTLCGPIDGSPLGSSVPEILQARILEWIAISFSNAWK